MSLDLCLTKENSLKIHLCVNLRVQESFHGHRVGTLSMTTQNYNVFFFINTFILTLVIIKSFLKSTVDKQKSIYG